MNFLEAMKSGKPFKRPEYHFYIYHMDGGLYWDNNRGLPAFFGPSIDDLCVEDLLTDDWTLREETSTITRSQADQAMLIARHGVGNWNDDYHAFMTLLGFDPSAEE